MGDLRYLADNKLGDFDSPFARAQIGAALSLLGDGARAAAFASALDLLRASDDRLLAGRLRLAPARRRRLLALVAESGMPQASSSGAPR